MLYRIFVFAFAFVGKFGWGGGLCTLLYSRTSFCCFANSGVGENWLACEGLKYALHRIFDHFGWSKYKKKSV